MNKMLARTFITSGTVISVMVVMYLKAVPACSLRHDDDPGRRDRHVFLGLCRRAAGVLVERAQKGKLVEHLGRSGAGPQVSDTRMAGEAVAEGRRRQQGPAAQTTVRRGRR